MRKLTLRWLGLALLVGLAIGLFTNHFAKAQAPGVNSPFQPVWTLPYDSIQRTYSQTQQLSPGAFALDISTLCGASGILTKLKRIYISGRATAVSPMDIYLLKRSNWDVVSPTPASAVGVPWDANDAASQAAVTYYGNASNTGALTQGTLVGVLAAVQAYVGNLTTGNTSSVAIIDFTNSPLKAPTLRSATQCLAINLSGTSQGGNLLDITWEWTEE